MKKAIFIFSALLFIAATNVFAQAKHSYSSHSSTRGSYNNHSAKGKFGGTGGRGGKSTAVHHASGGGLLTVSHHSGTHHTSYGKPARILH